MRFLIALLFASSAHASYFDGNLLLSKMRGSSGEQLQALGYIQGVHDAFHELTVCNPPNVTGGQVFEMVKNYLENVPATRHFSADVIIERILANSWPCKSQKNNSSQKNL